MHFALSRLVFAFCLADIVFSAHPRFGIKSAISRLTALNIPRKTSGATELTIASPTVAQNLTNLEVTCDDRYGRDLDVRSCYNALGKIGRNYSPLTFGERGTGNWDVILPYRFLSGTSDLKVIAYLSFSSSRV